MPRLHALLVGIDVYAEARPLTGCVNDVDAIQGLLIQRLRVPPEQVQRLAAPRRDGAARPTEVPTQAPTRDAVLAALDRLAGDAVREGDRVLIYYSGHGTQRVVEGAGGSFVREALVPTDDRVFDEGARAFRRRLVFDWELNARLRRIGERTPAVTVILDCCCSAGVARDLCDGDARARYAAYPDALEPAAPVPDAPSEDPGIARAAGRCLVVAACLANERALEADDGGRSHGLLTRALLDAFAAHGDDELPDLRWDRIWRPLAARVSEARGTQHPWLSDSPRRRVFGGPAEDGDAGIGVSGEGTSFRVDAGTLSGITEGAELGVYPAEPRRFPLPGSPEDATSRVGTLRVLSAERARALAVPVEPSPFPPLPPGARARLLRAGRASRLSVALTPYDEALATALARSDLLAVATEGVRGDVALTRGVDGPWILTDDIYGDDPEGPRLPSLPGATIEGAVAFVEHYRRFAAPLRLARGCLDQPLALRVSVLDCGRSFAPASLDEAQHATLPEVSARWGSAYALTPGDLFCVRVDNTSQLGLYVTVLLCENVGTVRVLGSRIHLRPRGSHMLWCGEELGAPFMATLSPGASHELDQIVAVGTTDAGASLDGLAVTETFFESQGGTRRTMAIDVGSPAEAWTAATAAIRTAVR